MIDQGITIGHTGLNVTDLDRSIDFYRDALGVEIVGGSDADGRRYAFLGSGGIPMITLWQQSAAPFATDRAGLHHLAFQVPDVAALAGIEARLRALGAAIRDDSGVTGEPAAAGQFFCFDPDGIRLEFHALERPSRPAPATGDGPACGFF
ncbi:VOC family protein [Catellatospora paridis]|uniref:VOC family protein n=1 Tax=Catellatospora paridis TaxID=1617086 RepID=UPI0012D4B435|nr:VOC family protein [Catellatospora paridis]